MIGALKDTSERVVALTAGGVTAVPFSSNIGQAFRRGEFFAGLFILGFSNGIFERITQAIARARLRARSWTRTESVFLFGSRALLLCRSCFASPRSP